MLLPLPAVLQDLTRVRTHSTERDVIVLRGPPSTAASVHLTGHVVFSLPEALSIKRVTLRLYATLRLSWIDPALARNTSTKPIRYERTLFEHEWPNLEAGNIQVAPAGTSTHTLHAGNHELPFDTILPGTLDESVEGLDGGQVIYKLVATIERGRFANNLVAKRHLRVVRTLGPDALELSQTMSMENVWPNKVEYSISIPAKAIAIGSYTPLDFQLTPLLKGLKLGQIKVQLLEFKRLESASGLSTQSENVVVQEVTFPPPEEGFLGEDEWNLSHEFYMPTSLSKCTQDCQIGDNIKVSHKLSFAVSLLNPDGHTSELRATLPVYVFISPNVAITSLHPTLSQNYQSPAGSARHSPSGSISAEDQLFPGAQNVQFGGEPRPTGANSNAPPNYENHIYDTLWREIPASQFESPLQSGANTPFARSRRNSFENAPSGGLGLQDSSRLLSDLYALQERQNREDGGINSVMERSYSGLHLAQGTPGSAAANLLAAASTYNSRLSSRSTSGASTPRDGGARTPREGVNTPSHLLQMTSTSSASASSSNTPNGYPGDYFNPAQSPDFAHLSYPTSPLITSAPQTPPVGSLDLESLSRVPSYQTAINSTDTTTSDDYTPSYEEPTIQAPAPAMTGSSLPRHLMASLGSKVYTPSGNNNGGGSSNAAFQRQMNGLSALSAPGSSSHLSGLSKQIARYNLNGSNDSTHVNSQSRSVPDTRVNSRNNSSTNLAGLGSGHSSQGSSSGFFKSSSKTHLSSLANLSLTSANGSNNNSGGSSGHSSGSGGTPARNSSSGFSNSNRNSSSRSLLDEASRFLHLHK